MRFMSEFLSGRMQLDLVDGHVGRLEQGIDDDPGNVPGVHGPCRVAFAFLGATKERIDDARQEQGEAATTLVHDQLQSHGYRYMQAQIAEPLCLVCHGENLAPQVEKVLDEYYPQDMATGYQPGQVRGAVSVSRLLREHCSEGEAEC